VINDIPVIDGVIHPYNLDASNYGHPFSPRQAAGFAAIIEHMSPPGYGLKADVFKRDWSIEETANVTFLESYSDLAAYHVLPLYSYKDGLCSLEKGIEAKQRWPDRFVFYAGVDPMDPKAIQRLEEQYERLEGPIGLKLYPNSYLGSKGNEFNSWTMDDREVAFPVFQRAQELGIKVVAVHKALPLGGVGMDPFKVSDVDSAALEFPDLNFEVVHGGMAFIEETCWQIERFPNVWVNLETTSLLLTHRPGMFEDALARMAGMISDLGLKKLIWGTGCIAVHPRPLIEAFVNDFQFSDQRLEEWRMNQITLENKKDILARNYFRMLGLDLDERLAKIADDEFAQRWAAQGGGPAEAWSTTGAAALV
jgi:uncharacterized protein